VDPSLPCAELYLRLGDDEVLVLDCRETDDWERHAFHIPGALWMPLAELRWDAAALPDDELIVICGCAPDGSDARRACRLLRQRGLDAICLEGGLLGWISNGLPIECHSVGASVAGLS
jgi:rhodanese-related sulfurtransferase